MASDMHPTRGAARCHTDSRVLVVDNYDSFSHNLAQYAEEPGAGVEVVGSDAHRAAELIEARLGSIVTHAIISPGPGISAGHSRFS